LGYLFSFLDWQRSRLLRRCWGCFRLASWRVIKSY
jgi:hypothetical protein